MIKCPKCETDLKSYFNPYPGEDADYVELFLECENQHQYFIRIKQEDLIED